MRTEEELLSSTDWDVIELNFDIDVEKLQSWYYEVTQRFSNLKFNISMTHLYTEILQTADGVDVWGMSWPVEQDLPILPRYAARPDLYPETNMPEEEFKSKMKVMERYKFGYFKELLDTFGEDTLTFCRVAVHSPGARIQPHSDGERTIRLHIPIVTNNESWIIWDDRKYNLKPGRMYLINTVPIHSTINNGATSRAHIISYPTNVSWLLEQHSRGYNI
jgi:hypothetical protein